MQLPHYSAFRVCRRTYGPRGIATILRRCCGLGLMFVIVASPRLLPHAKAATSAVFCRISGQQPPTEPAAKLGNDDSGQDNDTGRDAAGGRDEGDSTSTQPRDKQIEKQTGEQAPQASTQGGEPKSVPYIDLLAKSLPETWTMFSSKENTRLGDVWKVVESNGQKLLICTGTPKGFLLTKRPYQNFELSFEWKYMSDPNGNSGVLAFTRNEPRLWPTSLQVQLHQPSAGSIFPSGDAMSDNTTEATGLALEVGKWNKCRVVARNGKVSVEINGKQAGEVSGCKPDRGFIALQSEGSETHFRRILIRELLDQAPSIADETSTSVPPPASDKPGGSVETDG